MDCLGRCFSCGDLTVCGTRCCYVTSVYFCANATAMCEREVSAPTKMCNHIRRTLSYLSLFNSISMSSRFYRFLARFSGRRRLAGVSLCPGRMPSLFPATLLVLSSLLAATEACSSRSTPKPRPPSPTPRPNITFHTYACPPAYAAFYCLNGATCFTVKIGESLLYNCECADGYMGQRCEFKDLDGSYLPSRQRVMLETASIASGATIAVFLVVIVCAFVYIHYQRKQKQNRATSCVDGSVDVERRPQPFSRRSHHPIYPLSRITTEGFGKGDCPPPTLLVPQSATATCGTQERPP